MSSDAEDANKSAQTDPEAHKNSVQPHENADKTAVDSADSADGTDEPQTEVEASSSSSRTRRPQSSGHPAGGHAQTGLAVLMLGALGIVFGDIGTSPLYALKTVFAAGNHAIPINQGTVYGIISLVVWSITLVVSVKYVLFILRADNEGEGGIMALIALVQRLQGESRSRATRPALVALGIFGASLFFGDAMITPAISVLSAVEGLEVVRPGLEKLVVPISLTILALLFAGQRFGTTVVGRLFGPICLLWFATLAAAGIAQIITFPGVLVALSPTYAISFAYAQPGLAFLSLTGIVLVVTGVEALYADMGHFSRRAISRAWFYVVFPALTLNYLGQAALILHTPGTAENPFFLLFPAWALLPIVLLATAATVIASQAVISGAFSVSRQAVQLGFLPRLFIRHTSRAEVGQVYVPSINWMIFLAVVTLVLGFRSSENLAAAYGIAVTGTLAIDSILFFVVVRSRFRKPLWLVALGASLFLTMDMLFFSANLGKIVAGGWFPLGIALAIYIIFSTWNRGRELVTSSRTEEEGPLREFIKSVHAMSPPIYRVPGTAVFLNANTETTPLALRANVEHNHTLHESVVILSVNIQTVPNIPESERITVDDLGYTDDGIFHINVYYGFQDKTDIPAAIALAAEQGLECPIDLDEASYFLSRIALRRGPRGKMAGWRKALFLAIAHNAANPVEYFNLPVDRTVVMGGHITI